MNWILENWGQIALAAGAVFGAAQAIARLTPTKKDDEIISKIGKLANIIFSATRTKK